MYIQCTVCEKINQMVQMKKQHIMLKNVSTKENTAWL